MLAVRPITVAECDEGMPPELTILFKSHLRSAYQCVKILSVCATVKAINADTSGEEPVRCVTTMSV